MDERQFTEAAATFIRHRIPNLKIGIQGDLEILITPETGEVYTIFLLNAFREYKSQPESLDLVLETYLSPLAKILQNEKPLSIENVLPVVRTREFYNEQSELLNRGGKPGPAMDQLNEILVVMYVQDMPELMKYVTTDERAVLESGALTVAEASRANLRRELTEVTRFERGGVVMLTAGGDYESSLLLLDEYWKPESYGLTGPIVVTVPSRDVIVFSDESNFEGIASLCETALMSGSLPHNITDKLFIRDGKCWKVFRDCK